MDLQLLLYVIVFVGTAGAVLIVLYATKLRKKDFEERLRPSGNLEATSASERWRVRTQHSVSLDNAKKAGEELRTLKLEREILGDAIRRLYEAHAEGRITEEEREQLAESYKERMFKVKDALTENESIVALHELEAMQEDLAKLFNDRFNELNRKIETLREQVKLETKEEATPAFITAQIEAKPLEESHVDKTKTKTQRKTRKSRKTVAEERIEKIRSEVEKVLDRLEQMEAEA